MKEIWKDIQDCENKYQVSNLGNVRSLQYRHKNCKQILKPAKDGSGYLFVRLFKKTGCKCSKIHRLVAEAFIENVNDLPQVNHIDEDKTNNKVSNLEWCTAKYNSNYGTRNQRIYGKSNKKSVLQFSKDGTFIRKHDSINKAAFTVNVTPAALCKCLKNINKTAGGFIWKYEDKE